MMIQIKDDEIIFLDYLDETYLGEGYKLVDGAPKEAVEALESYMKRANALRDKYMMPK